MIASLSDVDLPITRETVKLLDDEASGLRSELLRLQSALTLVDGTMAHAQAHDLVQANEHLVLAALHAETIAETAVGKLDQLARSSQRDALTGTPDRALMLERINAAISMARRHRMSCAVLFLDLDNFKHLNDAFGHDMGDAAIKLVAERLQGLVRKSDAVGRHGGDEFLILLAEVQHDMDVPLVANKILAGLAMPATLLGQELVLSASLGIAIFPDDGEDAATLISRADAAMYHSKRQRPGCYAMYRGPGTITLLPQGPTGHAGSGNAARLATTGPHLRDLLEANERLVVGAMAAQERQLLSGEEHQQQIRFLAMVAHELRSPLAPLGTAAALLSHALSDESLLVRLQAIIKRQVAHMARLVDDLLDGSRAATGGFRLDKQRLAIAPIIAAAVDSTHSKCLERNQKLNVELPKASAMIEGDAVRLAQVFSNLLDNASKYTPAGGSIALRSSVRDNFLSIVVSDNGIGISAAALPRIFDLFVQEGHAIEESRKGLGVGLAVVRELVEAHGGTVACNSAGRDCGSTFTVTLPLVMN